MKKRPSPSIWHFKAGSAGKICLPFHNVHSQAGSDGQEATDQVGSKIELTASKVFV